MLDSKFLLNLNCLEITKPRNAYVIIKYFVDTSTSILLEQEPTQNGMHIVMEALGLLDKEW